MVSLVYCALVGIEIGSCCRFDAWVRILAVRGALGSTECCMFCSSS